VVESHQERGLFTLLLGVTRQGVVLADLQTLLDCQLNFSLPPTTPPLGQENVATGEVLAYYTTLK
jgi:hypothetical protein